MSDEEIIQTYREIRSVVRTAKALGISTYQVKKAITSQAPDLLRHLDVPYRSGRRPGVWPSVQEIVQTMTTFEPNSGCWLWLGATTDGYGTLFYKDGTKKAYRLSYEAAKGPIPKGMHLDHLCRVTLCVNPDHLEPVTNRQNVLRGIGPTAVNSRKTHCIRGHEFTPENTRHGSDGRKCRACCNEYSNRRYHRIKQIERATR